MREDDGYSASSGLFFIVGVLCGFGREWVAGGYFILGGIYLRMESNALIANAARQSRKEEQ